MSLIIDGPYTHSQLAMAESPRDACFISSSIDVGRYHMQNDKTEFMIHHFGDFGSNVNVLFCVISEFFATSVALQPEDVHVGVF